ncbi:MAG: glycosyltransferase family 2 protein [bacterium]|nr:glycosyltransferase family 2 protein [bacterium]
MIPGLLSVIIPNWNGGHFLPTCLDALERQTYPHLEIIVVDNASHDGSQALIGARYPHVRVIALPVNRGFTGACNAGLWFARGEYIALLNNDTEADAGWAAAVIDLFERHPEAGAVASKMLLLDQRDHLHTAGDYFTTSGRAGNRGVWERDDGQYDTEAAVFSACGGSSVYRRAMLDEIGSLDDDFFFSGEDVDLGWRAQLAGWRCLYTPRAVVYHQLSATGGGVTASYHDGRNLLYILIKNFPAGLWVKYRSQIVQEQAALARDAVRAWRGKAARARLRGMIDGLLTAPRAWRKRPAIQRHRRLNDAQIDALLTPRH